MSDPAKYRTRDEVEGFRGERDPLEQCKQELLAMGASEDDLKAIDKEIKERVKEAADFAEHAPEPEPSELYTDVLVEKY